MKPSRFFKFQPITPYLVSSLKECYLWASDFKNLNDPFDGRFGVSESFLAELSLKAKIPTIIQLGARRTLLEQVGLSKRIQFKPSLLETVNYRIFSDIIEGGCCCFTTDLMNELMWAHYANNGKGVCLEFDFSQNKELLDIINPVLYEEGFPIIESDKEIEKIKLKKRLAWEYEKEWRILTNAEGKIPFKIGSLKAIYFGYSCNWSDINSIRMEVGKAKGSNVEFHKIEFDPQTGTLIPRQFNK